MSVQRNIEVSVFRQVCDGREAAYLEHCRGYAERPDG